MKLVKISTISEILIDWITDMLKTVLYSKYDFTGTPR